jgi:hypothetical protein
MSTKRRAHTSARRHVEPIKATAKRRRKSDSDLLSKQTEPFNLLVLQSIQKGRELKLPYMEEGGAIYEMLQHMHISKKALEENKQRSVKDLKNLKQNTNKLLGHFNKKVQKVDHLLMADAWLTTGPTSRTYQAFAAYTSDNFSESRGRMTKTEFSDWLLRQASNGWFQTKTPYHTHDPNDVRSKLRGILNEEVHANRNNDKTKTKTQTTKQKHTLIARGKQWLIMKTTLQIVNQERKLLNEIFGATAGESKSRGGGWRGDFALFFEWLFLFTVLSMWAYLGNFIFWTFLLCLGYSIFNRKQLSTQTVIKKARTISKLYMLVGFPLAALATELVLADPGTYYNNPGLRVFS